MADFLTQDAVGSIKYLKWKSLYHHEKPFNIFLDPPKDAKDQRTTNLTYEDRETYFRDVRGHESSFSLDGNGFIFRRYSLTFDNFEDPKAVETEYLPEVERIIKQEVEGADKIFIFDWRVMKQCISFCSEPRAYLELVTKQ